jgi:hypothetical protein
MDMTADLIIRVTILGSAFILVLFVGLSFVISVIREILGSEAAVQNPVRLEASRRVDRLYRNKVRRK